MRKGLFPAGRLDKDTTGMMIITDDGEFAHNILAPRKHIEKTYRVQIVLKVVVKKLV
jgi:16S rRNA pseudouridine516 synthase